MKRMIIVLAAAGFVGVAALPAQSVDQRRENQQDRIAQGVRNGSLNAGQTARLEGQEAKINQQVRTDRAANGGKLTAAEKKQVNKEQNVESRRIYNNKHK